jgi:uncharacterized protein (DUF1778 family)
MLDIDNQDLAQDKGSRTTQVRHGDRLAELIEEAVTALGIEKSVFLRGAIAKEAARVLEDQSRHVLTRDDAAVFEAALDAKPQVTAKARRAKEAYHARVVHAD